jgi:CheY-like chemotaxis protein
MASVLIVDDHPDSCEVVMRYLERSGHNVVCVPNGRLALNSLTTATPDVILLDLMMPVMDGAGFLQVVRSYLRWADLPVIILTAYPDSQQLSRALSFKVARVFHKADMDLAELLSAVNNLVPAGRQRDTHSAARDPAAPKGSLDQQARRELKQEQRLHESNLDGMSTDTPEPYLRECERHQDRVKEILQDQSRRGQAPRRSDA